MRVETITCDVCGAQKKEANHWFVATASVGGTFCIQASSSTPNLPSYSGARLYDLCSEPCAIRAMLNVVKK